MEKSQNEQIPNTIRDGVNVDKKYYCLIAGVLAALLVYIGLSIAGMIPGGDYVIQRGDLLESHIAYIKMLCRHILNGENIWYSYDISLGMNTSLVLAYYAFSPFNILFLILNKMDDNIVVSIVILLKVACAASFFQLFSKHVLKVDSFFSILFGICYSLCGFSVGYCLYHIMWFDGFLVLPLLCMAIHLAVKEKKYIPLIICYVYLFVSQFYIGYMVGIFSFIFLLAYLVYTYEKTDIKKTIIAILGWFCSACIAVLISSIVWLPALLFLINNKTPDSTGFENSINITILEIINSLFCGQFIDNVGAYSYSYCGIPALLTIPFYFFNKKISLKERLITGGVVVFLGICYLVPFMYKFMHAFDAPDFFWYRFAFLLSFVLCVIAVRQSQYWREISLRKLAVYVFLLASIYAIEQQLEKLKEIANPSHNSYNFIINMGFILGWVILAFVCRNLQENRYKTICLFMVLLIGAEEIINMNSFFIGKTKETDYYQWKNIETAGLEAVNNIENGRNDFYRIIVDDDYSHNSDSLFGYNGVSDFGSVENYNLRKTLSNLGFGTSPRLTCASGYNPASAMMLGVRYYLFHSEQSDDPSANISPIIVLNENALNLGYMVEDEIVNYEFPSRNDFYNINDLLNKMTGKSEECFTAIPDEEVQFVCDNASVYYSANDDEQTTHLQIYDKDGKIDVIIPGANYSEPYLQFQSDELAADENDYITYGFNMVNSIDFVIGLGETIRMNYDEKSDNYSIRVRAVNNNGYERIFDNINCYDFNQDVLDSYYEDLSKEQLEVTGYKAGYVKGRIKVESNRRVLLTTIPYDESWTVRLNGIKVPSFAAVGDAFLAIEIPDEGEYEVEMKYEAPGVRIGTYISIIGIVLIAIYLIVSLVMKKRKEVKVSGEKENEYIG